MGGVLSGRSAVNEERLSLCECNVYQLAKTLDECGEVHFDGTIQVKSSDKTLLVGAFVDSGHRGKLEEERGETLWKVVNFSELAELYRVLIPIVTSEKLVERMKGYLEHLVRTGRA